MLYFSYSPDDGFEFHNSKDAAIKSAIEALKLEGDRAGDGWSEEVVEICWGIVCQNAQKINERPAEPGSDFDYLCEYKLKSINDLSKTIAECIPVPTGSHEMLMVAHSVAGQVLEKRTECTKESNPELTGPKETQHGK